MGSRTVGTCYTQWRGTDLAGGFRAPVSRTMSRTAGGHFTLGDSALPAEQTFHSVREEVL